MAGLTFDLVCVAAVGLLELVKGLSESCQRLIKGLIKSRIRRVFRKYGFLSSVSFTRIFGVRPYRWAGSRPRR